MFATRFAALITGEAISRVVNVSSLTTACVILCVIAMQATPLVWAHVNGFELLGVDMVLPAHDRIRLASQWAESLIAGASARTFLAVRHQLPSGGVASVYVTPIAYSPPDQDVVSSSAERQRRLAQWLSASALSGTAAMAFVGFSERWSA